MEGAALPLPLPLEATLRPVQPVNDGADSEDTQDDDTQAAWAAQQEFGPAAKKQKLGLSPHAIVKAGNEQAGCRNHTGYIGVRKRNWGMYAAEIRDGSKRRWLGSFSQAKEAGMAYDAALILQKKHRAKTNFIYSDFATIPRPNAEHGGKVRYNLIPKDIMDVYREQYREVMEIIGQGGGHHGDGEGYHMPPLQPILPGPINPQPLPLPDPNAGADGSPDPRSEPDPSAQDAQEPAGYRLEPPADLAINAGMYGAADGLVGLQTASGAPARSNRDTPSRNARPVVGYDLDNAVENSNPALDPNSLSLIQQGMAAINGFMAGRPGYNMAAMLAGGAPAGQEGQAPEGAAQQGEDEEEDDMAQNAAAHYNMAMAPMAAGYTMQAGYPLLQMAPVMANGMTVGMMPMHMGQHMTYAYPGYGQMYAAGQGEEEEEDEQGGHPQAMAGAPVYMMGAPPGAMMQWNGMPPGAVMAPMAMPGLPAAPWPVRTQVDRSAAAAAGAGPGSARAQPGSARANSGTGTPTGRTSRQGGGPTGSRGTPTRGSPANPNRSSNNNNDNTTNATNNPNLAKRGSSDSEQHTQHLMPRASARNAASGAVSTPTGGEAAPEQMFDYSAAYDMSAMESMGYPPGARMMAAAGYQLQAGYGPDGHMDPNAAAMYAMPPGYAMGPAFMMPQGMQMGPGMQVAAADVTQMMAARRGTPTKGQQQASRLKPGRA